MERNFRYKIKTYSYYAILIFFFIKSILFLISSPLKGYTNNFDANRYTRCYAVFPVDNSLIEKAHRIPIKEYEYKGFYDNPLIDYNFDQCFLSSELLFQLPTFLYSYILNEKFPLISIGLIRILTIAFFLFILHLKFKMSTFQKAQILILSLLISDPAVLLYFNSFYAEPSGIIFLSFLLIILSQLERNYNFKLKYFFFFFAILLFFTKKQYSPLAFVFICLSIIHLGKNNRIKRKAQFLSFLVLIAITLLSSIFIYKKSHYNDSFFKEINKTNTILGFIFKYSKESQIKENFKLSNHCDKYIGKNWFEGEFWNGHPCPEIAEISYSGLVFYLLKNPSLFINLTNHALSETKGWINFEYAQTEAGKLEDSIFTLNHLILRLESQYFIYFFSTPMIIFVILLLPFRRRNFPVMPFLTTIVLIYLSFYASIFGDGTFELTKHLFVFYFLILYFYLCLTFQISYVLCKVLQKRFAASNEIA